MRRKSSMSEARACARIYFYFFYSRDGLHRKEGAARSLWRHERVSPLRARLTLVVRLCEQILAIFHAHFVSQSISEGKLV